VCVDLCGERVPGELQLGCVGRLAAALQAPPVVHLQRLDARPVLHRRRQPLGVQPAAVAASAAHRRAVLGGAALLNAAETLEDRRPTDRVTTAPPCVRVVKDC